MKTGGLQVVARNKKATYNYHVEDSLEAGMVLCGTEVKSLRDGKAQMTDAYVVIEAGEAFVNQLHIAEYSNGTHGNHEPKRRRKLLMHRAELDRLRRKVKQKGVTLIPLEIYFKNGRAKMKVGLCRGKKDHDKRAAIKERDVKRDDLKRGREYE